MLLPPQNNNISVNIPVSSVNSSMSVEQNNWMKFKDRNQNKDIMASEASLSKKIPQPSQRSQSEFGRSSQRDYKSSPESTSKPRSLKKKSKRLILSGFYLNFPNFLP